MINFINSNKHAYNLRNLDLFKKDDFQIFT